MKRTILLAPLAAVLLLSPLTTLAAGPPCPPGDRPPLEAPDEEMAAPGDRHFDRLAEILDLSETQRQQIDELRDAERQKIAPYLKELQENRAAIHELTRTATFDEAAVRKLAAKQAAAKTEVIVAQARTRSQIYALLTPEQRKLADRLTPRRGRGEHRGPRR